MPKSEKAWVPDSKIHDYLLSFSHPVGGSKAIFFIDHGFRIEQAPIFAEALIRHAQLEVARIVPDRFGIKYLIDAAMLTPDGRSPIVRSVWIIDTASDAPRLVTAYPKSERGE